MKKKKMSSIDRELLGNVTALCIVCGLVFVASAVRTLVDYFILVCYE